jgi:mRNA interferase MazF
MITRPLATARPSDLPIDVLGLARLPAPSMIRWKLFTLTNDVLKWTIGTLDEADRAAASQALAEILPDQPGAAF